MVRPKVVSFTIDQYFGTLKNKIYKYMTSTSKNKYIDKIDDIVNKYNSTYHRTITINEATDFM